MVVDVRLDAGYEHPIEAGATSGQLLTVPDGAESLVLAAPVGEAYAVRVSTAGGAGEWVVLQHAEDESPDGPPTIEVIDDGTVAVPTDDATGPGAEGYRDEVRALPPILFDEAGSTVEVINVDGDGRGLQANFLLTDDDRDGPPSVAGRVQTEGPTSPEINPRSAWTDQGWSSGNGGCGSGPWYSSNLQAVVVHHTVTTNAYSRDQVDDLLRAILFSHVDINGWCDVGYNFLVDRFGDIWEGRSGGVEQPVIGGHAKGFNTSTMGVALLGQHQPGSRPTATEPSAAAAAAVADVAQWKLDLHGIDPSGTTWLKNRSSRGPHRLGSGEWHLVPTIMGHRDLGLTSCPGNHGLDLVADLSVGLVAPGAIDGVHRYAAWNPYPHGPAFVAADVNGELRTAGAGTVAEPQAGDSPIAPPSPSTRAVAAVLDGNQAVGWTLHGDGVLHPFGGAIAFAGRPAGDREVVDAVAADARGGWVISADGGVFGFGDRDNLAPPTGSGPPVVAGDLTPEGDGYLLDAAGGVTAIGRAPSSSIEVAEAVDLAVLPSGRGAWVVTADGDIETVGRAPEVTVSSPGGLSSGSTVVSVMVAPDGAGGWLATTDGRLWPIGRERLVLPLMTDSANGVVDVVLAGSHLPASFLDGADARYLQAVSVLFRDRAATADELTRWEGWLTYRGGRQEVTTELAATPEWVDTQLEQMYLDVLGRAPDQAGLGYWGDRMASGMPLSDVGGWFYGSAEYVEAAGTTEEYVELLYRNLLGRDSDGTGLTQWSAQIDEGDVTPAQVAAAFLRSSEYRRKRATELFVEILGRDPESDAVVYWAQRLGQTDDGTVAAELAASDEFFRRSTQ
ncbi:MAG: DUF4214 domain-containing protein [Actinomycetota bacterium]